MLHDLKNQLAVHQSIGASVDATSTTGTTGAWVDCGDIVNVTTLLVNAKAAAGTLTAAPITCQEADDSSGTGSQQIGDSAAAGTVVLNTPLLLNFQRTKRYCRATLGTIAGSSTAVIVDAMFLGQKRTVNS